MLFFISVCIFVFVHFFLISVFLYFLSYFFISSSCIISVFCHIFISLHFFVSFVHLYFVFSLFLYVFILLCPYFLFLNFFITPGRGWLSTLRNQKCGAEVLFLPNVALDGSGSFSLLTLAPPPLSWLLSTMKFSIPGCLGALKGFERTGH